MVIVQVAFEQFLYEFPGRSLRALQRRHDVLRPKILSSLQLINTETVDEDALLLDDEQDDDMELLLQLPKEIASRVLCLNSDRGSLRWFATFAEANRYVKGSCDKRFKEGPFLCLWRDALDCKEIFLDKISITTYYTVHNKDTMGNLFTC